MVQWAHLQNRDICLLYGTNEHTYKIKTYAYCMVQWGHLQDIFMYNGETYVYDFHTCTPAGSKGPLCKKKPLINWYWYYNNHQFCSKVRKCWCLGCQLPEAFWWTVIKAVKYLKYLYFKSLGIFLIYSPILTALAHISSASSCNLSSSSSDRNSPTYL